MDKNKPVFMPITRKEVFKYCEGCNARILPSEDFCPKCKKKRAKYSSKYFDPKSMKTLWWKNEPTHVKTKKRKKGV